MNWTPERIAAVKKMVEEEGLSAGMVAKRLGGVTRNAVIGMCGRRGIALTGNARLARGKGPVSSGERKPRAPRAPRSRRAIFQPFQPPKPVRIMAEKVAPLHIWLDQINEFVCNYPYGDNSPYTFCGHKVWGDKTSPAPYCRSHHFATRVVRAK